MTFALNGRFNCLLRAVKSCAQLERVGRFNVQSL